MGNNLKYFLCETYVFPLGKGLGHTLARRGAFLLQTKDHSLALRSNKITLCCGKQYNNIWQTMQHTTANSLLAYFGKSADGIKHVYNHSSFLE